MDAYEEWLGRVFDAANWTSDGGSLRDIAPSPSAALIDSLLHLRRERRELEARLNKR